MFHQHRGDGAVHHGHQNHQVGQDQNHPHFVDFLRIRFGRVPSSFERGAQVGRDDCIAAFLFIRQAFQRIFGFFNRFGIDRYRSFEFFKFLLSHLLGSGHIFRGDHGRDDRFTYFDDGRCASRCDFIGIADRTGGQFLLGDVTRRCATFGAAISACSGVTKRPELSSNPN